MRERLDFSLLGFLHGEASSSSSRKKYWKKYWVEETEGIMYKKGEEIAINICILTECQIIVKVIWIGLSEANKRKKTRLFFPQQWKNSPFPRAKKSPLSAGGFRGRGKGGGGLPSIGLSAPPPSCRGEHDWRMWPPHVAQHGPQGKPWVARHPLLPLYLTCLKRPR